MPQGILTLVWLALGPLWIAFTVWLARRKDFKNFTSWWMAEGLGIYTRLLVLMVVGILFCWAI